MPDEVTKRVLSANDTIEELPLKNCELLDLFRAGFRTVGDLAGESEASLKRRIGVRNQRGWGKTKIAHLQQALEASGLKSLPKIFPRT